MTAREQLLREIQHSPEPLIREVLDFLLEAGIILTQQKQKQSHGYQTKTIPANG